MNRKKIINDPVYGFITVPSETTQWIIDHPWFQRLSRIRQLGLTSLVYPGALHTRFHHAVGAMHLMSNAVGTLRSKGHRVTDEEADAVYVAILLHDIGHGPFSHALENLLTGVSHEYLSEVFMDALNKQLNGKIDLAIAIFKNEHPKKFLHQLVSSQLDVDRLDYLNRDSFFTGVSEGVISSDRIIQMLEIADDQLVVEEKGIYSVEKFIVARRLMYWQVYLHKTVLAAEYLLANIIERARELMNSGSDLFGTQSFKLFLKTKYTRSDFKDQIELLQSFAELDDFDVLTSIKVWCHSEDVTLSELCKCLINRNIYKIEVSNKPFEKDKIERYKEQIIKSMDIGRELADYFVFEVEVMNNAYLSDENNINILFKSGELTDIAKASDNLNISSLASTVTKYFLCRHYSIS